MGKYPDSAPDYEDVVPPTLWLSAFIFFLAFFSTSLIMTSFSSFIFDEAVIIMSIV